MLLPLLLREMSQKGSRVLILGKLLFLGLFICLISAVPFPFLGLFFNIGDFIILTVQWLRKAFATVPQACSQWQTQKCFQGREERALGAAVSKDLNTARGCAHTRAAVQPWKGLWGTQILPGAGGSLNIKQSPVNLYLCPSLSCTVLQG